VESLKIIGDFPHPFYDFVDLDENLVAEPLGKSPVMQGQVTQPKEAYSLLDELQGIVIILTQRVPIQAFVDIVKLLRVPEEKVVVTYVGVDPMFRPLDREKCYSKINTKYGLSGSEYIVSVGELHPGKNFVRLIQAFSKIKNNNAPYKLLIVEKKGWRYQDIYTVIEDLDLKNDVIFTDYVPFEELPVLYNGAALCVYPTLYEGFGLPALEAMACGTPLVTSNVSSLPEVVGDGGILVDPYNVDLLSEAIVKVLSDYNLRRDLRKKGLFQAKKFTWEKAARKTLKVYEEVYNKATCEKSSKNNR